MTILIKGIAMLILIAGVIMFIIEMFRCDEEIAKGLLKGWIIGMLMVFGITLFQDMVEVEKLKDLIESGVIIYDEQRMVDK